MFVLDAETFEVIDTIEPLSGGANAVDDGALWLIEPDGNVLQRFDIG